jgi:hypothetical protein
MKEGHVGPFYVEADMGRIWAAVRRIAIMLSLLALFTHVITALRAPQCLRVFGVGPAGMAGQMVLGVLLTLPPVALLFWHPPDAPGVRRALQGALVLGALISLGDVVYVYAGPGLQAEAAIGPQLCALSSHAVRSLAWLLIATHP